MSTLLTYTRRFAHQHDELPAFHAAFLIITILSAALLSLGFFAALICIHLALDFVKYREVHAFSMMHTLQGMLRESLRDIMLLGIGLTCTVYLHHTMGLAAVSGLVRSEFLLIRAVGTVAPRYFILNEAFSILIHLRSYLRLIHPQICHPLSRVERLQLSIIALSIVLLIASPFLMGVEFSHVFHILLLEMKVWI